MEDMKRVIMDTNFIMELIKNKIDIKKELCRILDVPYELAVTDGTFEELNKIINEQKGKDRETAKLALCFIKGIKAIKGEGSVDETLIKLANKDSIVATQDKGIKKKIRTGVIVIRQKKYLQLI